MKTPSAFRALLWALAASVLALGLNSVAAKPKRPSRRPAPPVTAKRADGAVIVPADSAGRKAPQSGPIARNPGPVLPPGSPIADRTTIAPFPIPGDTSSAASDRAKVMNVPRPGLTLTGPLPAGMRVAIDPRTGNPIWIRDSLMARPRSH